MIFENFQISKNVLGQFIPNVPPKHVVTSTNFNVLFLFLKFSLPFQQLTIQSLELLLFWNNFFLMWFSLSRLLSCQLMFHLVLTLILMPLHPFYSLSYWSFNSSVTRQKGESQNGCFKKTKHATFSEKQTLSGGKNVRF